VQRGVNNAFPLQLIRLEQADKDSSRESRNRDWSKQTNNSRDYTGAAESILDAAETSALLQNHHSHVLTAERSINGHHAPFITAER